MKTNMVAPQELGRSAGGVTASKGWSQVNQADRHCTWAHKIYKPAKTVGIVKRDESRDQGSYEDRGFDSRKVARKDQPPRCRSKVVPHFKIKCGRIKAILCLRRCPQLYEEVIQEVY
jgi:hypothetical protein